VRIFLSYASENRSAAEEIVLALRERGHKVFFDRDGLAAGDGFHQRIEREVRSVDLVLFLISPHSVAEGSYTLTELLHVMRRLEHPRGRVLPVMVAATPLDRIPAYLRAVTIFEPQGSLAAEVASAVDALRPGVGRKLGFLSGAGIAALAGLGWLAYEHWWSLEEIAVTVDQPLSQAPALFDEPATFSVGVSLANQGTRAVKIDGPSLVAEPAGSIVLRDAGDLASATDLEPGAVLSVVLELGRKGEVEEWQLCWREDGERRCEEQAWQPAAGHAVEKAFEVPAPLARSAVAVVATDGGFLVAASGPARLVRLSMEGQVAFETPLAGEITALTSARGRAYVGTRGPAVIASIDATTGALPESWPVTLPPGLNDGTGSPVSEEPASLAGDADVLWLVTRGTSGEPGLLYKDGPDDAWTAPPYYPEVSFALRDMHLRAVSGRVWGSEEDTTPASLYRFGREALETFGGHDFEAASCTRDVADLAGKLVVWTCDGRLHALEAADGRLRFAADLGVGPAVPQGAEWWDRHVLAPAGEGVLVAVNLSQPRFNDPMSRTVLAHVQHGTPTRLLLALAKGAVVSMAAAGETTLAVLEDRQGQRDTLAFRVPRLTAQGGVPK
jgi:hypothetical protein